MGHTRRKPLPEALFGTQVAAEEQLPRSREERLERWATLLEHAGRLNCLHEIEHLPRKQRWTARKDDSPLTVAFQDALLRRAGLAGDTLGHAMAFFRLSEGEAHRIVCDCDCGADIPGWQAATSVRAAARRLGPARTAANRATAGVLALLGALLLHGLFL